jgi:hypothetical protein
MGSIGRKRQVEPQAKVSRMNYLLKQLWEKIKVLEIKENIVYIGSTINRGKYLEYGKLNEK